MRVGIGPVVAPGGSGVGGLREPGLGKQVGDRVVGGHPIDLHVSEHAVLGIGGVDDGKRNRERIRLLASLPVSSAQAAWGGQPHAEDERHEQRDRFLRERCRHLRSCCFRYLSSPFLFPRAFLHADARDWARAPAEDRQRRFAADNNPAGLLCYAIKPRPRARSRRDAAYACTLPGRCSGWTATLLSHHSGGSVRDLHPASPVQDFFLRATV